MIVVDASVWIDYFNGFDHPETDRLDRALGTIPVVIGDVTLTEVLMGFRRDADYRIARRLLGSLTVVDMLGERQAIRAAEKYRALRRRRIKPRSSIDLVIANWCIEHDLPLLFRDRDFRPFVSELGLRDALRER